MTLDEILVSLFGQGHAVARENGLLMGQGRLANDAVLHVVGVYDTTPVGIEAALHLAGHVIGIMTHTPAEPILVLIDSGSQRIARRDELLGLNQYLAHLAKTLLLAAQVGHPTLGLLYGQTAAGAFIATALATDLLVALPGAHPAVMDLPSMARITKLPLDLLEEKARCTPVFAPGLDNLALTGGVAQILNPALSLSDQVVALLARQRAPADTRDRLGAERGGRVKAAAIAQRVYELARATR